MFFFLFKMQTACSYAEKGNAIFNSYMRALPIVPLNLLAIEKFGIIHCLHAFNVINISNAAI